VSRKVFEPIKMAAGRKIWGMRFLFFIYLLSSKMKLKSNGH